MERLMVRRENELALVAVMFSDATDGRHHRGIDRWRPERSTPFPADIPDDPHPLADDDPRIRRGCELRRVAELREQRNVGRMLDLIWAGRVLRAANEAQADPVLDAQMRAIAKMLRESYGLKAPLPDDPAAALRQVIDLSACPVPWRRFARRR